MASTQACAGWKNPSSGNPATGAYLVDADGKRYLDYHAAFGPIILGHNHPAVNAAVAQAMTRVDLTGVGTTELEIRCGGENRCSTCPRQKWR